MGEETEENEKKEKKKERKRERERETFLPYLESKLFLGEIERKLLHERRLSLCHSSVAFTLIHVCACVREKPTVTKKTFKKKTNKMR